MDDQLIAQSMPAPGPRPGPACHATGCTEHPLVQWQRRLTEDELAQELAIIQGRRDQAYALRDVEQPWIDPGPLPTGDDYTRTVHACGPHAIHMDAATQIHAADCAGPDSGTLPDCGCEPEPHPEPVPMPEPVYPDHWATAMAGGN